MKKPKEIYFAVFKQTIYMCLGKSSLIIILKFNFLLYPSVHDDALQKTTPKERKINEKSQIAVKKVTKIYQRATQHIH